MEGKPTFLSRLEPTSAGIALTLFLAAFLFRLVGIGWGLPGPERFYSYHPDEPVNIAVADKGPSLTPKFYNYGTLYLNLTTIAAKAGLSYSGVGEVKSAADAAKATAAETLGARIMSALMGAGMAALAFLLLYRRTHVVGAVLAGLLVAAAPGLVVHSRFATVDVPAAFFALLSLYWASRIVPREGEERLDAATVLRFAVYAGLWAGVAGACKYNAILVFLAVISILWMERGKDGVMPWVAAAGATALAFLVGVPAIFLDSQAFLKDFAFEFQHTSTGHGTVFMATTPGFLYQLGNLVEAFGILSVLLGAAGLARAAFRQHSWAIGLLVFAAVYYILIGRAEVKFLRYVFPLIPVLAVGAGWIVGRGHVNPNSNWKALGFIGLIGLGGIMGGGLATSGSASIWMTGKDPRDEAAEWLKANIVVGEKIGIVGDPWFYTPPLYPAANAPVMAGWPARQKAMEESPIPIVRHLPPNPDERFDLDSRLITEDRPEFIVESSFEIEDYKRIAESDLSTDEAKLFRARYNDFSFLLGSNYQIVQMYGTDGSQIHDMMYIRPRVYVWRRKGLQMPSSKTSSTTSESRKASASTP